MNDHQLPLDQAICDQLGSHVYQFLSSYGVTHILDVDAFRKVRGYRPVIGSIFLFGEGGSYDFIDEHGREITILNGTLYIPEVNRLSRAYLALLRAQKPPIFDSETSHDDSGSSGSCSSDSSSSSQSDGEFLDWADSLEPSLVVRVRKDEKGNHIYSSKHVRQKLG